MSFVQPLESRTLLSSVILNGDGQLRITGNATADNVVTELAGVGNGKFRVTLNGAQTDFKREDVRSLVADLGDGSDLARINALFVGALFGNGFAVPVTVNGGA